MGRKPYRERKGSLSAGGQYNQGGIQIREDWEFDPGLRTRIASFLDRFFEGEDSEDTLASAQVDGSLEDTFEDEPEVITVHCYAPVAYDYAASKPEEEKPSLGSVASSACEGMMLGAHAKESAKVGAAPDGLRSWLNQVDEPFSTTLMALIDRKGMRDADVYKRAHLSRQLFSRIRSDAEYRPAKKTVLALAVGLQLNPSDARDVLERAGFALSRSSKRDVIVEYFLTNGKHDLMAINEALYEFDQPLL